MTVENADILVTCKLGFENVVATYIKELDPSAEVIPAPYGLSGMVVVVGASDKHRLAEEIRRRIPEAEKVYVVEERCRASIPEIVEAAKKLASGRISSYESFAVRTTRRGKHDFTSIDVNVAVGAAVKELTGARVDLENPDKVVVVEIVHDWAFLSLVPGSQFYRKMKPYKYPMYKLFRRITVAHEPYLGPLDAAYNMGVRVGREVQTFEVGELVVAPIGPVDARQLMEFLRGVFEGIESRYQIQQRSYGREAHRVRVVVQDLYQFVRSRMNEPMIVFEPEGEPISRVADKVKSIILEAVKSGKRINVLVGAREGIPTGVFRFASIVLDVAPGIVISTDYALASALIALATVLHEDLAHNYSP